jgi:organic radical activating enzyme
LRTAKVEILIINANADKIRFLLETGVTALKNTYDLVDEMLISDASDRANFEKIEKK